MALDNTKLTLLTVGAPSTGPRIWGYVTAADNKATVGSTVTPYFKAQNYGGIKAGDLVIANCSDGPLAIYVTAIDSSTSTIVKTTPA